jgi:lysophospholipase L1-like esterase
VSACRRGLVALGDSITVGEGSMAFGVTALSWAQWLARALGLPYTSHAVNGATTQEVVGEQVPRVRDAFEVGCLFAGVNDVRSPGFALAPFAAAHARVLGALAERCDVVVCPTIPLDLGRPRAGAAKVAQANDAIRAGAGASAAVVVALEDLRGWPALLPDAVHPTALGQVVLAERAARALAAAGHPVTASPWALADPDRSLPALARHAPAAGRALARDLARRAREGALFAR